MLIADQIDIAIGQGLIRCNIVGKFDNLDVNPLFFRFLGHGFDDFGMRSGRGADFDFLIGLASTLAIIPLATATGKTDCQDS